MLKDGGDIGFYISTQFRSTGMLNTTDPFNAAKVCNASKNCNFTCPDKSGQF